MTGPEIPQRARGRLAQCLAGLLALALGIALPGAGGCGKHSPAAPSSHAESPAVKFTSASFRFLADRVDADTLGAIADLLEPERVRFMSDLGVDVLAVVSVWVWQDPASFYADMQARIGQVYPGAGGWVPERLTVSVLATGSSASTARTVSHEVAHVVSIAVNATIPNNPRWLWETVALYENREFVDPTTLEYMRSGRYPSLADLNAGATPTGIPRQIYEVGYVLGQFIVDTWGLDGLIRLIEANGNVPSALGVGAAEFESRWHAFLHSEYGLPVV